MSLPDPTAFDDACYLALKARDARFDGNFFTGVTSTGIYCRPVCRVRTPKRQNCRFFQQAAQAEQAGFRPCLRCRPELAPRQSAPGQPDAGPGWSMQDACGILAQQAARLMDNLQLGRSTAISVAALAQHLGISDRHLRRIFEARFGLSPLRYLQTRRLLCAKQLLTDTDLPVAQVAALSGFASLRRFHAVFAQHYQLQPTQLRKTGPRTGAGSSGRQAGIEVQLAYRPPYDVDALLRFLAQRALSGSEIVTLTQSAKRFGATLRLQQAQQSFTGWLLIRFDPARCRVHLTVSDTLANVLPLVMARVRSLLDLDADPRAIDQVLQAAFPAGAGMRLPGALDGFELAIRAVLGQQITVAAARTLAQRLMERLGEPLDTPVTGLTRLFPSARVLADASGETLGQLGIVRQRQDAIRALAQAVDSQSLLLEPGADLDQTLTRLHALSGIGDWTAQYIVMRALAWPDAFPSGDVALQKALGVRDGPQPARAALAASLAWQPWRSYAVIRAWAGLAQPQPSRHETQITS